MVSYPLQTHATDDVIADTDIVLRRYFQLHCKSPTAYAESLAKKSLRCGELYNGYVLEAFFKEGQFKPIHHSLRS